MMSSQLPHQQKPYYYAPKASQYRSPNFQSQPLVQSIDQYLAKQSQQHQQPTDILPQIRSEQSKTQTQQIPQLHHLPQMYQPSQSTATRSTYSYQATASSVPVHQYNNYTAVNEIQGQQQQQQQLPSIQQIQQNRTPSPPLQKLSSSISSHHNQYFQPQSQNISPIQSQAQKYHQQKSYQTTDELVQSNSTSAANTATISHQPTLPPVQTYAYGQMIQPLQQINSHSYSSDSYHPSESTVTHLHNPSQQQQEYPINYLQSASDINNMNIIPSIKGNNAGAASTISSNSSGNAAASQASSTPNIHSQTSLSSVSSQPSDNQLPYHQVHMIPQQVQQSQNYGYYPQIDAGHHDNSSYAPQYGAAIHPEVYHVSNYSHSAYNNSSSELATYSTSATNARNGTVIGVMDNGIAYDGRNSLNGLNSGNSASLMSVSMSISAEGTVNNNMTNSEDAHQKRRSTLPIIVSSKSVKKNRVCPLCHKIFNRPSGLKTHMHIHTGEKPYKCDWAGCGKYFSVRSNMIRHNKIHKRYEWENETKNHKADDGGNDGSVGDHDRKHDMINLGKAA